METQRRVVTKQEAHELIDSMPGDVVYVLTYKPRFGCSSLGRRIKKRKGNHMVDTAKSIELAVVDPIMTLNLYSYIMNADFDGVGTQRAVNSILLANPQIFG